MGQIITELVVNADTSGAEQYTKAMEKASGAMEKSLGAMGAGVTRARESAAGLTSQMGLLGLGIAAASGTAVLFLDIIGKMNAGLAQLGETARMVGLSVERFQEVQFAFKVGGASDQDISSSLTKMTSTLNDAKRNENELTKLLDANNIRYKQRNGELITTNQLLLIAADLIKRAASPQDERAIGRALGIDDSLLPALREGAAAFQKMTDEARTAGAIITRETVESATQFDKEWRKSSTEWSFYMRAMLSGVLPYIDDLILRAADFAKTAAEQAKGPAGNAWQLIKDMATETAAEFDLAKLSLEQLQRMEERTRPRTIGGGEGRPLTLGSADENARIKERIVLLESSLRLQGAFEQFSFNGDWMKGFKSLQVDTSYLTNSTKIPAKDTLKDPFDRAVESIERHIARMKADALAVGQNVGVHEQLRTEFALLEAAKRADNSVTDDQIALYTTLRGSMSAQQAMAVAGINLHLQDAAAFKRVTEAAKEAAQAAENARIQKQVQFAKDTWSLSSDDVQIAQQLRGKYATVAEAIGSVEAAELRAAAAGQKLMQALEQGFTGFIGDLVMGVNGMVALIARMGTLGDSMTQIGSKSLFGSLQSGFSGKGFNFDPASLAIGAIGIGLSLITQSLKKHEEEAKAIQQAKEQWAGMQSQFDDFINQMTIAVDGSVTQSLAPSKEAANDNPTKIKRATGKRREEENDVDQLRRVA